MQLCSRGCVCLKQFISADNSVNDQAGGDELVYQSQHRQARHKASALII